MPDTPTTTPPARDAALVVVWDGTPSAPWGPYLADDLRRKPAAPAAAPPQERRTPDARPSAARDNWARLQGILSAAGARPYTSHELAAAAGVTAAVMHAVLTYRVRVGDVAVAGAVARTASSGFATVRAFVITDKGRDRAGR